MDPPQLQDQELLSLLLKGCGGKVPHAVPRPGCSPPEMEQRFGINADAAARLGLAIELGRRSLMEITPADKPFEGGRDVYLYLAPVLQMARVEEFWALYLDAKGRMLHQICVSQGTLTSSLVHPREVFAPALLHRAASVLVAHNHPSGDPEPSAEDHATTRRLCKAGRLLGIELLDHIVVGAGSYFSFLENGVI